MLRCGGLHSDSSFGQEIGVSNKILMVLLVPAGELLDPTARQTSIPSVHILFS